MDHIHVLATIEWVGCFVIGCVQIAAYFRFKSIDRLHIIRKRFPGIVRLEAALLIFVLFLVFPMIYKEQMNIVENCVSDNFLPPNHCQNIGRFIDITAVLTRPCIHLLIFLEAAR